MKLSSSLLAITLLVCGAANVHGMADAGEKQVSAWRALAVSAGVSVLSNMAFNDPLTANGLALVGSAGLNLALGNSSGLSRDIGAQLGGIVGGVAIGALGAQVIKNNRPHHHHHSY